jgi:hypothetical protein
MTREAACGMASAFGYGIGAYALFTGAVALGGAGIVLAVVLHVAAVLNGGEN